jgi:hypothetical protein
MAALVALAGAAYADNFNDNFDSYATGALSTVSGGVWNLWGGAGTDAQVATGGLSAPNAMRHNGAGTPDVVTYWSNALAGGPGKLAFDFKVHEDANRSATWTHSEVDITLGAGNPALLDTNYGTGPGILVLGGGAAGGYTGTAKVQFWDVGGAEGGGDFGFVQIGTVSTDAWHHAEVVATLTVADPLANDPNLADGFFDVFVDAALLINHQSFGMNDANGWNMTETWSNRDAGNTADEFTLIDNMVVTPEPSSLALLALALVLRRR